MRISEVSKIFDIPQETLRYIEQRGLVHPVRNQENGYREYDLPAFSELLEYMRFRNMGLSVHSISQIYQNGTLDTLYKEISNRRGALEQEISYASLLKEYLDVYLTQIETLRDNIGLFRFEKRAPSLYVCSGIGDRERYSYADSVTATQWRKYVPFVSLGYRFNQEQIEGNRWHTTWVFSVDEAQANALNLYRDDIVMHDAGGICLSGYIAYSTWEEAQAACRKAALFANEHEYEATGESTVLLMLQQFTGEKKETVAQLYMPLMRR